MIYGFSPIMENNLILYSNHGPKLADLLTEKAANMGIALYFILSQACPKYDNVVLFGTGHLWEAVTSKILTKLFRIKCRNIRNFYQTQAKDKPVDMSN